MDLTTQQIQEWLRAQPDDVREEILAEFTDIHTVSELMRDNAELTRAVVEAHTIIMKLSSNETS